MPIAIRLIAGAAYTAEVTPPHGGGRHWVSPSPMNLDDLIAALLALGCHQTDIGDALYEADPDWDTRSSPSPEVRVEDWSMGLIAGSWRHPDGDGYPPEPGSGEMPDDLAGDVWVEGPGGIGATIAWRKGEPTPMELMHPSRGPADLGAFNVSTDVPPITRRDTEAFLRQLLPSLRALVGSHVTR